MICFDFICEICVLCGIILNVKSWQIEVLLCMFMNNLDLEVVEYL